MPLPVSLFNHRSNNRPDATAEVDWTQLPSQCAHTLPVDTKEALPLWGPYKLKRDTDRANGNVWRISCLVLDYDAKHNTDLLTLAYLREVWGVNSAYIHSTWSHSGDNPSYRVVIPLQETLAPSRYKKLLDWAFNYSRACGINPDPACIDPARLWYKATPWREGFEHTCISGTMLDGMRQSVATGNALMDVDLPADADQEFLAPSLMLSDGVTQLSIVEWFEAEPVGAKWKIHCPFAESSSVGSAFVRRRESGTMLVCTSQSHGHLAPHTWWCRNVATGVNAGVLGLLSWRVDPRTGAQMSIKKTITNGRLILENDTNYEGRLWFNEFTHEDMLDDAPLEDADDTEIQAHFEDNYDLYFKKDGVREIVHLVCMRQRRHPLKDYLEDLRWDGTSRIHEWITNTFVVDNEEVATIVGRKSLIQAVARLYRPGCKADCVLVLQGPQGCFKSTALSILASSDYFCDTTITFNTKDGFLALQRAWIFELQELDSMRRSQVEQTKAFLSSRSDSFRFPYAKRTSKVDRHTVFMGTTNEDAFLHDSTGSRRFWPVRVNTRASGLKWLRAHRDQLWAEAVHMYKIGEQWHLTSEEFRLVDDSSEAARSSDPWESLLSDWIQFGHRTLFTTREVLEEALQLKPDQMRKGVELRAATVLKELGYIKIRRRIAGVRSYWWCLPKDEPNEDSQDRRSSIRMRTNSD